MESRMQSNPYQPPSENRSDLGPAETVNRRPAGWKPLIGGLFAAFIAVVIMAYGLLFAVPRILRDLENQNLESSPNLTLLIDFLNGMYQNGHWVTIAFVLALCLQHLVVPVSLRQRTGNLLGVILMLVSLAVMIWVLVTVLLLPY